MKWDLEVQGDMLLVWWPGFKICSSAMAPLPVFWFLKCKNEFVLSLFLKKKKKKERKWKQREHTGLDAGELVQLQLGMLICTALWIWIYLDPRGRFKEVKSSTLQVSWAPSVQNGFLCICLTTLLQLWSVDPLGVMGNSTGEKKSLGLPC